MEFDPIETCPYDEVHRIRRSRMQFHITICAKNFPSSEKVQCPFDARHKVNQVEIEYHIDHCPGREAVIDDPFYNKWQVEEHILPIDVNPVKVSDAEKWDVGEDFQSYSPLQAIRDKPIVYPIIGLSKAKRRKHRMQERMRYNQIVENGGNQSANENFMQSNSLSVDNEEDEQEEKPLRRPYSIGNKINKQLPPKKSVGNGKDDDENYRPLRQPHTIHNKSNSAPQDKNENRIPAKNLKKIPPKVNKTSNVPVSCATALSKNEKSPVFNKPKVNESIIDELSKTFEEIIVKNEDHKKKIEKLDKEINNWKTVPSKKRK